MGNASKDDLKRALLEFASPGPVAVPIRDRTFYVRVMTAFDSAVMGKALEKHKADDGLETGRVLSLLICDERGSLLYDIANVGEVNALARLAPDVSRAIFAASHAANGLDPGN